MRTNPFRVKEKKFSPKIINNYYFSDNNMILLLTCSSEYKQTGKV